MKNLFQHIIRLFSLLMQAVGMQKQNETTAACINENDDARENAADTTENDGTSEINPKPPKTKPMAKFEPAYKIVADHEGGYQKKANDSGNYNSLGQLVGTNWGINARVYEGWIGYPPDESDMRSMEKSTAKLIFKKNYWLRAKCDLIHDQQLATFFFDGVVNHGVHRGTTLLQEVLKVEVDGIVGSETLTAIDTGKAKRIFNAYKKRRLAFYRAIVNNNPDKADWLPVWEKRMSKFKYADIGSKGAAVVGIITSVTIAWGIWWINNQA